MPTSVWEVSHDWWSRVKLKMKRAVVFVDAGMAEMLHWSGGMALLLQAGALDIRDFSSFEVSNHIINKHWWVHWLHFIYDFVLKKYQRAKQITNALYTETVAIPPEK